jgi:hypothetical protein
VSDHPHTREAMERWRQGKINIFDEMARLETERNVARRELQQLLESIKVSEVSIQMVDGIARPIPWDGSAESEKLRYERDTWKSLAEDISEAREAWEIHCNEWRMCAEQLAEAASDMQSGWFYIQEVNGRLSGVGWDRAAQGVEAALREFERLKGETK